MEDKILKYLEDVRMACVDVEHILSEYEGHHNRRNSIDLDSQ